MSGATRMTFDEARLAREAKQAARAEKGGMTKDETLAKQAALQAERDALGPRSEHPCVGWFDEYYTAQRITRDAADWAAFKAALVTPLPSSFRINLNCPYPDDIRAKLRTADGGALFRADAHAYEGAPIKPGLEKKRLDEVGALILALAVTLTPTLVTPTLALAPTLTLTLTLRYSA